jgi:phage protein U
MALTTLYQFGPVKFEVLPFNVGEVEHVTGTEYARKLVIDALPQREWVGESDEEITLNGFIYPRRIGGFANLEQLDATRLAGIAQTLIRGSLHAQNLGWFVCEHLERKSSFLSGDGIGQVIHWQATFARCDIPQAATYFYDLHRILTPP